MITGVRADLAIKVFGEDLDVLLETAQKIEAAIQGVEGAADIILEKVDKIGIKTIMMIVCPNIAECIILEAPVKEISSFTSCFFMLEIPTNC
mgnify:CR=1 FL=1